MTDLQLVTLTSQQLSYATAMVRWPSASCRDVIDYLRAHTIDDPELPEGEPIALAVSPAQLARNIGISARTARSALAKLVAAKVVVRLRPAAGSFPPVWFLSGDLPRWKVTWRVDPALAISKVASLITYAPYGGQQTRISCAPHGGQKSALTITISCVALVHRGAFAVHPRVHSYAFGSRAHRSAQLIAANQPSLSMPIDPSDLSSKQEQEGIEATDEALAVLSAIAEVTAGHHELWGPPRDRVVEAVAPLRDAGYIAAELRRIRPPMWKAAVEMVVRLARQGPPAPAPRTGPTEFVPEETDSPVDQLAAAAAIEAAKSALRPAAKWEDAG